MDFDDVCRSTTILHADAVSLPTMTLSIFAPLPILVSHVSPAQPPHFPVRPSIVHCICLTGDQREIASPSVSHAPGPPTLSVH